MADWRLIDEPPVTDNYLPIPVDYLFRLAWLPHNLDEISIGNIVPSGGKLVVDIDGGSPIVPDYHFR